MMFLQSRILVPMAAFAALGTSALAQANQSEGLAVHHAWSRETAAGQSVGGGFMTIANRGAAADRLLSGTSPVAAEVQLHTMTMDGGIMRMRRVEGGIAVPARGTGVPPAAGKANTRPVMPSSPFASAPLAGATTALMKRSSLSVGRPLAQSGTSVGIPGQGWRG